MPSGLVQKSALLALGVVVLLGVVGMGGASTDSVSELNAGGSGANGSGGSCDGGPQRKDEAWCNANHAIHDNLCKVESTTCNQSTSGAEAKDRMENAFACAAARQTWFNGCSWKLSDPNTWKQSIPNAIARGENCREIWLQKSYGGRGDRGRGNRGRGRGGGRR